MVKFKQHVISYGDTVQSIAQQHFGDMSKWMELVEFNNLRYPYIVDTMEEKLQNKDQLKTVGDTLLIKAQSDAQSDLISQLRRVSDFDQEEIYALALGKDLDLLPLPKEFGAPGWDSEILELKANEQGSIATARGIENLKQALYVRVITPLGSYVGHPRYGSNIHLYLGKKNTEENAALLDIEIERTLRTDGRVTQVEFTGHRIFQNSYSASFKVTSISLDEAFEFVVAAEQEGPIVLIDNFRDNMI